MNQKHLSTFWWSKNFYRKRNGDFRTKLQGYIYWLFLHRIWNIGSFFRNPAGYVYYGIKDFATLIIKICE